MGTSITLLRVVKGGQVLWDVEVSNTRWFCAKKELSVLARYPDVLDKKSILIKIKLLMQF